MKTIKKRKQEENEMETKEQKRIRKSSTGKTCRKTRGKTKRYSINYSRVFGKKKKKK